MSKYKTMNDRELLELAAKAAKIRLLDWNELSNEFLLDTACTKWWNPLKNDGDALRLAVKRKIFRCHTDLFHEFYEEETANGRDENEAARRAIVRAAAEIGKEMSQ